MSDHLEPRLHAYRPDLADRRLEGRVAAERFVDGVERRVVAPSAPFRRLPRHDAWLDTEALFGETVTVFEETAEGWAWGQLATDDYVGWLPQQALGPAEEVATHKIRALRTYVYPGPDIKLPPSMLLSMNARLIARAQDDKFIETDAGFIVARHLVPCEDNAADWVAVAERFVGTPYLWGGRTSLGLDCSALIQLALAAGGVSCPRDSDLQARLLGMPLERGAAGQLERGDILFWKGHVAIACDPERMVHASGHHMEVVIEPIDEAVRRIRQLDGEITGVRRIQDVPSS